MTIQQGILTFTLAMLLLMPGSVSYAQPEQPASPSHNHTHSHSHGPSAHEGDEGLVLAPQNEESVYPAAHCPADAPLRAYQVVAIQVAITLNRYLDYDPEGRMYVLAEELARASGGEPERGGPQRRSRTSGVTGLAG